ncbi:hypothetical protein [Streptomyces sp. AC627_RSS907]|nr:hypothetical protein [Streptomyces sp. AC627_RSS907]
MTCSTGNNCTTPVPLDDRGQRVRGWGDLVALVGALTATEERITV